MKIMRASDKSRNGMRDLAKFFPANSNMIEIGCYSGESTRIWLSTNKIKNIYCVDPWGRVINKNDHYKPTVMIEVESKFDELLTDSRITKLSGFSNEHLPQFLNANTHINVIYIDGDHSYNGVKYDIELALQIVEDNGIICGHDINHAQAGKAIIDAFGFVDVQFADGSWLKFKSRIV